MAESTARAQGYVEVCGDRRIVACIATNEPLAELSGPARWLDMAGADLALLNSGRAPLLLDHAQSVDSLVGVVERAWITGGDCFAVLRLGHTALADTAWSLIADGILCNVSIGMILQRAAPAEEGASQRVEYWRPYEVSLVTLPNNWQAKVLPAPPPEIRAALLHQVAASAGGTRDTWRSFAIDRAPAIAKRLGCDSVAVAGVLAEEIGGELRRLADQAVGRLA